MARGPARVALCGLYAPRIWHAARSVSAFLAIVISRNAKNFTKSGITAIGHVDPFRFPPQRLCMSRIVALDLARVGAAAWRDGSNICTRHFVLAPERAPIEEKAANLLAILEPLILEIRPDVVTVEDDKKRGRATTAALRSYHTVAMLAAQKVGARIRVDVSASRARLCALGSAAGGKAAAVATARVLYGLAPDLTDDEVDAVVLLVATERFEALEAKLAEAERARRARDVAVRKAARAAETVRRQAARKAEKAEAKKRIKETTS